MRLYSLWYFAFDIESYFCFLQCCLWLFCRIEHSFECCNGNPGDCIGSLHIDRYSVSLLFFTGKVKSFKKLELYGELGRCKESVIAWDQIGSSFSCRWSTPVTNPFSNRSSRLGRKKIVPIHIISTHYLNAFLPIGNTDSIPAFRTSREANDGSVYFFFIYLSFLFFTVPSRIVLRESGRRAITTSWWKRLKA